MHLAYAYENLSSYPIIIISLHNLTSKTIMASTESTATDYSHVIDWTEAMEQCGDDEDFLRELLSDLRGEIDAQIVKIDAVLEVSESERWALSLTLVLGVSSDAIFISM